ncbi:MAG: 30S ribosomal protein S8 [Patescibacteria group bacterium]|jgi:small subunit ribosomal protein S8
MTDPIADMLTRVRNALAVRKEEVVLPMSKMKYQIAKILEENGLVEKVSEAEGQGKKEKTKFKEIKIVLKYDRAGHPAISSIKRISKPGLRVYVKKSELPRVLNNLGIAIISTPKGLMTNREAKKKGLGGEVICEVY